MAKKEVTRYYSILRPVSIGTFPNRGKVFIRNFGGDRIYVPSIKHEAWGYIEYTDAVLTDEECSNYDLIKGEPGEEIDF